MTDVDEDEGPTPLQRQRAEARITAGVQLLQAARDGDWAAGLWLLERSEWRGWGPWHPTCAPDLLPATPIRIKTPAARRAARFLERSGPEDWCRRCRFCGGQV
jgi:hypothetical protein